MSGEAKKNNSLDIKEEKGEEKKTKQQRAITNALYTHTNRRTEGTG